MFERKPLIIVVATGLALAGCGSQEPQSTELATEAPAVAVETQIVTSASRPNYYEATGTVKAQFNATLSSKVMARVASVLAREGDTVRQGQVLVMLDSRELSSSVQIAQANLGASVIGVEAARTVQEMDAKTSAARIAQSEAAVVQAQAALGAAQSKLDLVLAGPRTQEKTQARLAVVQAESTLRLAKTQLDRISRLVAEGVMARKHLDEAQNAYELALAQRDTAVQAERIAQEGSRSEEIRAAQEGVAQARAALRQAESNVKLARASALQAKVRSQEIRSAKAQVNQSAAALRSSRVALAYGSVAAPFEGRVVQRLADPGAMALPGSPLMAVEGGSLRLEAVVPESVLSHVRLKSAMRITVDALDRELEGVVEEIVPQGNAASHTFIVKISLSKSKDVFSGMFGRAFVETGQSETIEVPEEAVWEREGLNYVYVVNAEGLARLRIVTIGPIDGDRVAILSGLSPGERIVSRGREQVTDGMKVASK